METYKIVQIVYTFVIFILTLFFILLPLKLIPSDKGQLLTRRSQRILDFCNSFAAGVFLGTCFIQLVPCVEAKFQEAFVNGGVPTAYCPTLTQVTIMLGFFLVLLMEQVVKTCQGTTQRSHDAVDTQEMSTVGEYVVAVSSSEESQGSDESDVELTREKKRMLKPKEKKMNKTKTTRTKTTRHLRRQTPENMETIKDGKIQPHDNHVGDAVVHSHVHLADLVKEDFGLRCIVLLFALSLHSLFEGMTIGLQEDLLKLINLTVGISVHECLVAFALGISLARQNLARGMAIKLCIAFSITIPVGIVIGIGVGGIHNFVGNLVSAVLQGLTAGTFVYVIFVEILPGEIDRNRDRLLKVFVMFFGFCVIGSLGFIMKG